MRVGEFEKAVFDRENIRIRIRAPVGEEIGNYNYRHWARQTTSVTSWLANRITPNLNGHEVSVINGDFEEPHGATLLRNLRASYRTG